MIKKDFHGAIELVLTKSRTPLRSGEIAKIINALYIYRREDGRAVSSSQILEHVEKNKNTFVIQKGIVSLNSG